MDQTIRQTTSDLEAQWTATNYAFRKRIQELEQVKNELEWQQKNVSNNTFWLYVQYNHWAIAFRSSQPIYLKS